MNQIITLLLLVSVLMAGCSNTVGTDDAEVRSTGISYQVPQAGYVKLWIENSYKTTVATLVDEHQSAGSYTVQFVAAEANGVHLPPGIYSYHFRTDTVSLSRILILAY